MTLLTDDRSDALASHPDLSRFAAAYPYGDYRRYASVDGLSGRMFVEHAIRRRLEGSSRICAAIQDDRLLGIAMVRALDWESEFFRIPMAVLDILVGIDHRRETAVRLLGEVLGEPEPYRHVSMRLDAADFDARLAAQDFGFRLMDTICTYEGRLGAPGDPATIEHKYRIRRFRPDDREAVIAVASECFRSYPSRFALDPMIGPESALAMYGTWAAKCCSGEMASELIIAELRGEVVGFLGWRNNQLLEESTGIRIQGSGLGGCRPRRFDAYRALLWHAMHEFGRPPGDFDTHLTNLATIRTYESLGFSLVRTCHNFHWWR